MEKKWLLTDDLLWDYADGFLTAPEKEAVEAELRLHPEWQTRLDRIQSEKRELFSMPLDVPDSGFADRVMAAWATDQVQAQAGLSSKDWIIRGIGGFLGLLILLLVPLMIVTALQVSPREQPLFTMPDFPIGEWLSFLDPSLLQYGLLLTIAFCLLRFLDKYLQHRRLTQELGY